MGQPSLVAPKVSAQIRSVPSRTTTVRYSSVRILAKRVGPVVQKIKPAKPRGAAMMLVTIHVAELVASNCVYRQRAAIKLSSMVIIPKMASGKDKGLYCLIVFKLITLVCTLVTERLEKLPESHIHFQLTRVNMGVKLFNYSLQLWELK